ncbi:MULTISPECIES: MFS transporter [Streptomyces]|uniref:Drug resistance transporter, EmrB/QacA subfamily n=1 Tax=Streptomyces melanosporofaciens TaxID=67327 RepID=A0A1H4W5B4_STRMJ|nr:MFS transporter [Streptomyces melanosporofaciens]SEC87841.1 drug resistance transporter, EmrB/QacA subfamily [Streptomyces melanosporofaciens]
MTDRSGPSGMNPVWTLVVSGLTVFMAALDNLVVITALPAIQKDLGTSLQDLEWTVNGYTLTFSVFLMAGAAAGDRFGRRRVFLAGLVVFTGASAAAALSGSADALIAARAVQGLGAAVVMPLTLTLLTVAVPERRRGLALGVWGALSGLAVALGPLIGGAVVEKISWEWIFWVNVPIGVLVLVLGLWKLAESTRPDTSLDPVGTVLVSLGVFGVVYALVSTTEHGWSSGRVIGFLAGGLVVLALFVGWELRTAEPMLPMRLFRNRAFSAVNAASLLMFAAMFGLVFLLTQFMQNIQGFSPLEAGVKMLPWTAMPVVVAPLAALLTARLGNRLVVAAGLLFEAVGLGWLASVVSADTAYADQVPGLVLGGIGLGLFFSPVAEMAMSIVAPRDQGIASGANNTFRELGGALGVAVLTSVFTTLGGYGSPQEFVDGLRPAAWIGAGIAALGCLAILTAPRGRTVSGETKVISSGAAEDSYPGNLPSRSRN